MPGTQDSEGLSPIARDRLARLCAAPHPGALLLGVVWAFWHLPDFLTKAQGGGPVTGWGTFFTNLPFFVVMVVAINIVMTWVYNHTQGSLFIALLVGILVPAVLIALLTRGRLGYQADGIRPTM